jgi:hypothetical protein
MSNEIIIGCLSCITVALAITIVCITIVKIGDLKRLLRNIKIAEQITKNHQENIIQLMRQITKTFNLLIDKSVLEKNLDKKYSKIEVKKIFPQEKEIKEQNNYNENTLELKERPDNFKCLKKINETGLKELNERLIESDSLEEPEPLFRSPFTNKVNNLNDNESNEEELSFQIENPYPESKMKFNYDHNTGKIIKNESTKSKKVPVYIEYNGKQGYFIEK